MLPSIEQTLPDCGLREVTNLGKKTPSSDLGLWDLRTLAVPSSALADLSTVCNSD